MKKLIALLLALMMVFVCTVALAGGDDLPGEEPPATEGSGEGGEGGSGEGSGSGEGGGTAPDASTTPAATTTATAADPSVKTGYDKDDAPKGGLPCAQPQTVTVKKKINANTGATVPAQTVSFTVGTGEVTLSTATSAPAVTIENTSFAEGDTEKAVTINLPAYTAVGVYTYEVTETDTNVAGMKYATDLELKITVINGDSGLVIAGIALRQKDVKTDTIENDYEAHDLTVGKTVSGNLGDKNKSFPITVVLTAPSGDKVYGSVGVTITGDDATVMDDSTSITTSIAAETAGWTTKTLKLSLKDGQTVKFTNLPAGVTYTVTEDSTIKRQAGETPTAAEQADEDTYKVTGEVKTAAALTADGTTVTINNEKNIEIDTGVSLDFVPYMLIMALALAGVALRIYRRREDY